MANGLKAGLFLLLVGALSVGCGSFTPVAQVPIIALTTTSTPPSEPPLMPTPTSLPPTPTSQPVEPAISPTPEALPRITVGQIHSTYVGDDFKIYVQLPEGYETDADEIYPVIYLLDANWYFDGTHARLGRGGVSGIVSRLTKAGEMPASILIGVGYVGENQRGRDFLLGVKKFYRFLERELIPAVDAAYRTDVGFGRTLIGHSDGGFCTMYVLLQYELAAEPLFKHYIALSGDYTKLGIMFRAEERLYERLRPDNLLPVNVYIAVGAAEESRFKDSTYRLAQALENREYRAFHLKHEIYLGHSHSSIVDPAIQDGLEWIFPRVRP